MSRTEAGDRNPFQLARELGLNSALWGPATRPRNFEQACAALDAVRAEALQRAGELVQELEAGRGAGAMTVELVHDLMNVVHAVDALKVK